LKLSDLSDLSDFSDESLEVPDREVLIAELRAGVTTMRDLGLFDLFTFRSPELAEILGVAPAMS
jgi:hypothetical protein